MNLEQLLNNNRDWVNKKIAEDASYFETLSKGQSPKILYIGCSDSRVTIEEILGLNPGEAFVHRNIANLVNNVDLSVMTVIEYAVKHLKVDHVIVCGHYECGGVKTAMQSIDVGILNPWLRNIRDVYRHNQTELDGIENELERYDRLVELNVEEQCFNVLKTAVVQRAIRERQLSVHGWIFDTRKGNIKDLTIDFKGMLDKIREIYHLD